MEECELCGKPISGAYVVSVEGVELRVCMGCAKGKRVVRRDAPRARAVTGFRKPEKAEVEVVDNYGSVMRKARESMKLPMKVLAEMINEKETLLTRVEQQRTLPTEQLVRKLQRVLNVKLEQESEREERGHSSRKDGATLGEFVS